MGAAAADTDVPAPPTTFRCNRKRMVMIVRVTLHHVSPAQINLETTPKGINLSTSGRRRYSMSREYPRGIVCDDTQTTANMEGNVLVIEMPITKLPAVEPHGRTPAQPAADTQKQPRKRKAEEPRSSSASAPASRAAGRAAGSSGASRKTSAAAPSGSSLLELAEEATAGEAARHEQGLSKMRKMQRVESDRSDKLAERKQKKESQKQQLLEALRKHKKETKKGAKKEKADGKAATPGGGGGRRVSFA